MNNTLRQTCSILCLALGLMTAVTSVRAADDNVVSVAAKTPELSTFYRLVQQAGLASTLSSGDLTVFAPTDDAFKALPAATLDKLSKDPEALKAVLTYHVLPAKLTAAKIDGSTEQATVNGAKLALSRSGDFLTVDDAMVVTADVAAGPSVIHEIDRVLLATLKK